MDHVYYYTNLHTDGDYGVSLEFLLPSDALLPAYERQWALVLNSINFLTFISQIFTKITNAHCCQLDTWKWCCDVSGPLAINANTSHLGLWENSPQKWSLGLVLSKLKCQYYLIIVNTTNSTTNSKIALLNNKICRDEFWQGKCRSGGSDQAVKWNSSYVSVIRKLWPQKNLWERIVMIHPSFPSCWTLKTGTFPIMERIFVYLQAKSCCSEIIFTV